MTNSQLDTTNESQEVSPFPAGDHIRAYKGHNSTITDHVAQLVTCLTTDTCLNADPGVAPSIPAWSHTFLEIDHQIISTAILLPSADSRRVVVSYKRKYVHKVLVNSLVKLAQEKSVVR